MEFCIRGMRNGDPGIASRIGEGDEGWEREDIIMQKHRWAYSRKG